MHGNLIFTRKHPILNYEFEEIIKNVKIQIIKKFKLGFYLSSLSVIEIYPF